MHTFYIGKNKTIDFPLRTDIVKGIDHSYYYEGYTTFKAEELKIVAERVLLLFVTASCSGVHYI